MIFRKVALERLSSPEQLDQLMQVTSPRGWLSLAAVGVLLAAALAWGLAGSIPTEAPGEGILIRQGGVSDLVAAANGQVEELLVGVGDEVHKGQVVARIRQDALERQLEDSRTKLASLQADYRELARYAGEQRRLSQQDLEQKRKNLERSIATLTQDLALLEEKVDAERKLLDEGLITKQTLLDTQQHLNAERDQLASQKLELNGLELKRLEGQQQLDQQLEARRREISDLELSNRELQARLAEDARIISPRDGRVLELVVNRGDVVSPGSPVLTLEVVSKELMAVIFVPATSGKQVEPGMDARISPATVKREEFGYIEGKVTWAADFPSTAQGMKRLLANDSLVSKLLAEGPLLQVDVALERSPATPTGYRWSSSTGPDLEITSGTLAEGSVIVRRDRPIDLVIPGLRRGLGL